MSSCWRDGHRFFVEVSPHPVLSLALQENARAADANVAIVGTLRRDQGGSERLLLSLGELHVRGLWLRLEAALAVSQAGTAADLSV